jgi:DNA-binding transcriptional LysR family regulator
MNIEPNDLLLFARVVDEGSFSRAAERMRLPKSTVSRRIAALEAQLGERLLLRTTRKLTITDFGRNVLEHAQQVAAEVDAASALAQHRQARPSGRLRVSMPSDFANLLLGTLLARFVAQHPQIALEIDLSPRRVDLVGENFDLAIRMGDLPDDASLAARPLATMSNGLYASPDYIARRGEPLEPGDLMRHDVLQLLQRSGDPAPWALSRGTDRWRGSPPARASANSPELLVHLARASAGIALASDHFAAPHVERGELVRVLPEWALPGSTAWAVFPERRLMPARTRVFLEALREAFSDDRCREVNRQLQAATVRRGEVPGAPVGTASVPA